jgi:hypothetical protein
MSHSLSSLLISWKRVALSEFENVKGMYFTDDHSFSGTILVIVRNKLPSEVEMLGQDVLLIK